MTRQTPLYELHRSAGARMVEFAGWELPLHFGSQIEEHHAVRGDAGMFDISHMTVLDVGGTGARGMLRAVLANDVGRLQRPGQALYSCMLNENGGIIDDLIVYRWDDEHFRIISNAATRERVTAWLSRQAASHDAEVGERGDLAMIAVQGPSARARTEACLVEEMRREAAGLGGFEAIRSGDWQVARTGYTGEDGYEVVMPREQAEPLWRRLLSAGVRPCGLGARDTLRLEAGLRLYGLDMDETVTPLEAGLAWTVAWEPESRRFVGRDALTELARRGVPQRFAGLVLTAAGVLRSHQRVVVPGLGEGVVTSGGYSPTLNRGIALARLPAGVYGRCQVEIRGRLKDALVVEPRFVRLGRSLLEAGLCQRPGVARE